MALGLFANQVASFAKSAGISVDKASRGISMSLFGAVIQSTPVDTGRARANWTAAGVSPSTVTTDVVDPSGRATTGAMESFILGAPSSAEFTLANNLPYAAVLEFGGYPGDGPNTVGGYSKQAPAGMVRVNVARFEKIVEEEAAKVRN